MPIVVIPVGIGVALWLAVPVFRSQLADVAMAFLASFKERGMPATDSMTDRLIGPAHGGPAAAVILLIILLPGLILDTLGAALTFQVLWPCFVCVLTLAAVVVGGALVPGIPSLFFAARAFVRRTRARWEEMTVAGAAPDSSRSGVAARIARSS